MTIVFWEDTEPVRWPSPVAQAAALRARWVWRAAWTMVVIQRWHGRAEWIITRLSGPNPSPS
jgi:hypothetical protein